VHIHTYIHTHGQICIYTSVHTYKHTNKHERILAYTYTDTHKHSAHVHTCVHTDIHTYTYSRINVRTNINTQIQRIGPYSHILVYGIDIYAHTYIHTYKHTYVHVYKYTHTAGDSATKHDLRHEIHLLKQSHFAEIEEIKSMLGMPKGVTATHCNPLQHTFTYCNTAYWAVCPKASYTYVCIHTHVYSYQYIYTCMYMIPCFRYMLDMLQSSMCYGVAMISRLLKHIGLFCRL
jgi:hypothetical protein